MASFRKYVNKKVKKEFGIINPNKYSFYELKRIIINKYKNYSKKELLNKELELRYLDDYANTEYNIFRDFLVSSLSILSIIAPLAKNGFNDIEIAMGILKYWIVVEIIIFVFNIFCDRFENNTKNRNKYLKLQYECLKIALKDDKFKSIKVNPKKISR